MKYPRHLRETPGTDTTHERVILRGESDAWCKRKVDTLPGRVTKGWAHELAPGKPPDAPDALQGKGAHTME